MNINDYIAINSNQSFQEVPFNEVDNLIFSELIYIPFDHYLSKIPLPLHIVGKRILADGVKLKRLQYQRMLKLMVDSKRYRNILLSDYVSLSDQEKQQQFAAITIQFSLFRFYVAFRGTDKQLYSWKEDFNMIFQFPVGAQRQAHYYLEKQLQKHPFSTFVVGGHSKGGNLAVYSSVMANDHKRIALVFNNDGPGFHPDFIQTERYQTMLHKMITLMPQSSMVAILMSSEIQSIIVFSDGDLDNQHDGFTWQIANNNFIREKETTKQSKFMEGMMNGWGNQLSLEEKVIFINNIYEVLLELNLKTIDDVSKNTKEILLELFERFRLSEKEDRKLYIDATKAMIKSFSSSFIETYITGRKQENENSSIE